MKKKYRIKSKNQKIKKAYRFLLIHKKIVIIILCAIIAVLVFFIIAKPLILDKNIKPVVAEQETEKSPTEKIDAATLAGLIGEDSALNAGEGEFAQEGIKIGITMTSLKDADIVMLKGIEKQAAKEIRKNTIADFYVYDADADENQQIQDVFSMINNGVKTLIIVNTTDYNFIKISDIAKSNGVKCIAYNGNIDEGFEVNVVEKTSAANDFANFIKSITPQTYVLKGTSKQFTEIKNILPVTQKFDEIEDAAALVENSIEEGTPVDSMICFDNNANDMLKVWLEKGTFPKAYAAYATVDFIKTWYGLLNNVPEVNVTNENTENEEETKVAATPETFGGFGLTKIENTGDILFEFALNIAQGKKLPTENYVYEVTGQEQITNANILEYYNEVKDLPGGFVFSKADTSAMAGLFS